MSVVDLLRAGRGASEAEALLGGGVRMTYRQLDHAVGERAAALEGAPGAAHPVECGGTDVATVVELLAAWRAGLVPVPLNARLSEREREDARAALDGAELPEGTQVVLWTSGTSGRPRGVALSAGNLRAITDASAERLGLGPSDVWLASLSPAHVGGLVLVVRALLLGGTLVAEGALDAAALARLLRDGGSREDTAPTHLSLVPVQLLRLLDEWGDHPAPEGLRCVLVGGAHAPRSLVDRAFASGWPIALTYGCTEMSSQIATAGPEEVREDPGSVGRLLAGVEARVAGDGELLVRGPARALGYVEAGGDTSPGALADERGWYHTGDLGAFDPDGRLRITGRRIDRIVSGGVTIDALEVEEEVRSHPAVVDACVVGVPDAEWGERVSALVVPVEGEFDPETLAGYLRDRLMAAKVPRLWQLAVALPRNPNGKVDRARVRALLSASRSTRPS